MTRDPIAVARSWVDEELVPELKRHNLQISQSAHHLFCFVLSAQVTEGLVRDGPALRNLLNQIPVSDIVELYTVKYGLRSLTTNRGVRLLGDLHDRWVSIRASNHPK